MDISLIISYFLRADYCALCTVLGLYLYNPNNHLVEANYITLIF